MTTKIILGKKVIISDPCYGDEAKHCHVNLNVLPGKYIPTIKKIKKSSRNMGLKVVHENYINKPLKWEYSNYNIGVDSGQAGIFSKSTFRNDEYSKKIPFIKGESPFGPTGLNQTDPGDLWYEKICDLTLTTEDWWGTYDKGVVSSSGWGDGEYSLYIAKNNNIIIGLYISFDFEKP